MKQKWIVAWWLIFAILIYGCSSHPKNLNSGLLNGKPCSPPCWQELTPGISDEEAVDKFLNGLRQEDWPERDYRDIQPVGCTSIALTDQPGLYVNRLVRLYVKNQRLILIESSVEEKITLGKIVERFGNPEYIEAIHAIGPDAHTYFLSVYYPSIGLKLDLRVSNEMLGKVLPEMVVNYVEYYPPGGIANYFSNDYACWVADEEIEDAIQPYLKQIQPWMGFGEIRVIESR